MIWVYIVAVTLTTPVTTESKFIVSAPNMAFTTESACQSYREFDMLRLLNTRPNKDAKAVSQCFSLPFNINKDV